MGRDQRLDHVRRGGMNESSSGPLLADRRNTRGDHPDIPIAVTGITEWGALCSVEVF